MLCLQSSRTPLPSPPPSSAPITTFIFRTHPHPTSSTAPHFPTTPFRPDGMLCLQHVPFTKAVNGNLGCMHRGSVWCGRDKTVPLSSIRDVFCALGKRCLLRQFQCSVDWRRPFQRKIVGSSDRLKEGLGMESRSFFPYPISL